VAHFHEEDGCYNALESWVPGGRVKQCNWAASGIATRIFYGGIEVAEHTSILPVDFGADANGFDPHGFVRSKPTLGPNQSYSQVCLTIEGSQISPDGKLIEGDEITGFYSTGGTCIPTPPGPLVVLPEGWDTMTIPGWAHPGPVERPIETLIIRHFDVVSHQPLNRQYSSNTLIYFADPNSRRPLDGLAGVLDPSNRRNVSLSVVVVLPPGSFKLTRKEFDEKMGLSSGSLQTDAQTSMPPIALQFTEDLGGAWASTFDVKGAAATVLVDAAGAFAWKMDGAVEPAAFREALQKHALPAAAPRSRLLDMGLRPGDLVPDAFFEDDSGEFTALRRLRGKRVLLNFWQSWSEPSLGELRRLQALHEKGGAHAPTIFAHSGDKDVNALKAARQANKLTFAMSHDPNRKLARQFRVRCWPTTLSVNPDGVIDHIQYGAAPAGRAVAS
jgi:peroxiredoxin